MGGNISKEIQKALKGVPSSKHKFFNSFYQKIREHKEAENFVFSPISIFIALAIVAEGLEHSARTQLIDEMGFNPENIIFKDGVKALLGTLNSSSKTYGDEKPFVLKMANAIYISENFQLTEEFKGMVESKYKSELTNVNFKEESTVDLINNWVQETTQGAIERLVDNFPPTTVMILLNALYFEGQWLSQFKIDMTKNQPFLKASGQKQELPFMNQIAEDCPYFESNTHHYVTLKYANTDAYMLLEIPKKNLSLKNILLHEMKLEFVTKSRKLSSSNYDVQLSIPKFKIENTLKLMDIFKVLGVDMLFKEGGFGSKMFKSQGEQVYVSSITQKATIDIDENGTKAAAVTSVIMGVLSIKEPNQKVTVVADKPFRYYVMKPNLKFKYPPDMDSPLPDGDIVLFMGEFNG